MSEVSMLEPPLGSRTLPALARDAAARWGAAPLCSFPNGSLTYAELVERMDGFAGALQHHGVAPGDRVAVLMGNRVEWMEVWFGICAAGAIEVPVNHGLTGALLAHCLADSGARVVVVESDLVAELHRVVTEHDVPVETCIVVGEGPAEVGDAQILKFADLERPSVVTLPEVAPLDPACIMYTSGTTGNAKGVVLPHRYFPYFGWVKAHHMGTTADDRIYNVYPMFNASGQCEAVMAAMQVGASVHTSARFSATRFWDDVRESGCTEFVYMGGILSILAKARPAATDAANPIRLAYGVPTPAHLHRDFEQRFGLGLVELYGTTETGIVTFNPRDERRVGSCGIPSCGYDVRVVDETDRDVPSGEVGEIVVRPRTPGSTMIEYWNLPEVTAEAWRDGWYRSGDIGRFDDDGYLYFVQREAEAIRHRGYMINASQIEAVLASHPDVLECAVVGIPDADRGEEEIKALVVAADGREVHVDALIELSQRELPTWMVPRFWEVRERIPKTPTQKFAKATIRRQGVTPATIDTRKDRVSVDGSGAHG